MRTTLERDRFKAWLAAAVIAAALASLLVYLAFCLYACPVADDFVARAAAVRDGVLNTTQRMYLNMTGRWTAMLLAYGLMRLLDPVRFYPVCTLLFALVTFGSLYLFFRSLLPRSLSRLKPLALAACALALLWSGMPDPGEALFWLSGYCTYFFGLSLVLVLLAAIASPPRDVSSIPSARRWFSLVLFLFAVVVAGVQELVACSACLILLVAWLFARRLHSPNRWLPFWALLGMAVGLVIVLVAPGNFARAAKHPHLGDLSLTFALLVDQLHWYSWQWVRNPALWGLTALLLGGFWSASSRPPWLARVGRPLKWLVPVLGAFLVVFWFALPSWVFGEVAPNRAASAAYLFFLFAWAASVVLWRDAFASILDRWKIVPRALMLLGALVLVVGLVFFGNTGRGVGDLRDGLPQAWSRAMHDRDATLRAESASGPVEVRVHRAPPSSLFSPVDIKDDPTYWINKELSRFYGLKTLRLAPPDNPPESPK